MFIATLSPCLPFKQLLAALKDLLTDCVLECSPNGITLQAMDSSHVSLCTFRLAANGFQQYECQPPSQNSAQQSAQPSAQPSAQESAQESAQDATYTLGVSIGTLDRLLHGAHRDDTLQWVVDDNQPDVLTLTYHSSTVPITRKTQFQVPLLYLDHDTLGIPNSVDYTTRITLPPDILGKVCKEVSVVGDTCCIRCESIPGGPRQVGFGVEGDLGKALVVLEHEGDIDAVPAQSPVPVSVHIHPTAPTSIAQSFSLRFLTLFAKFAPLSDRVVLEMDKDAPLRVTFRLMMEGESWVRLYLAPKMDESV